MVSQTRIRTLLCALLLAAFICLVQPTVASPKIDFYYFNPDSVQSNFSALKKGVDTFLHQTDFTASFQAFSQKVDFDRMVKLKQPALVFVPVWYYQHYGESLGLRPLLTPSSVGKTSYTKILLVRKNTPYSLAELKDKMVAMTTMGPETERRFAAMFHDDGGVVDLSRSNIIITPKDADALYALALGQVDAALVGRDTLQTVGDANQRVIEMVQEVALSGPLPMPLLCVTEGRLKEQDEGKLREVFQQSGKQSVLPVFMQMLRIDDWQNIN